MQKQVDFFANIPQEMKRVKQWVCRNGKIPINPYTGKGAKSNDPNTWSDYETAVKAMQEKGYDGIGFELGNGYIGIDLDKCIDDKGIPKKEALEVIAKMQSYTEISPSGTGYHIICKGKLPNRGRKNGFIEIYDRDRYFTMTGNAQGGLHEVFERTKEVTEVYNKYFSDKKESSPQSPAAPAGFVNDSDIIDTLLSNQKSGKLWSGNLSDYGEDESRADLALCSFIANHTKDIAQIDRIFRQSGLMREKWDRKTGNNTYGMRTILKSLENKDTFQIYISNESEHKGIIIPKNWEIGKNNTLWYLREIKKNGEVVDIKRIFVSRNTPFVTKRFNNVEYQQIYYELTWKDNHKDVRQVVPASVIAQKKELLGLSNQGLGVDDTNAKDLITFISAFLLNNTINQGYSVERIGNIKGKMIHPLIDTDVQIIALDIGESQLLDSFNVMGTVESWKNEVFSRVKDFPKALFFVLSSFASIVLKDLKVNPFIVDLSGTTSQGKTTLLKAAASVWGTDGLINEWNATRVSVERKAAFLNSYPLLMDDTRKADERVLKSVVYNHSGGRSKGRGSVTGSQKEFTWSNIILSTGEASLNEYISTKGGAAARIIPLVDEPIKKDYENISALHNAMRENYGAVGVEFVKIWDRHKETLIPQFADTKRFYADKARGNDVLIRISEYFAAVVFVARILKLYLRLDINILSLENLFNDIAAENKDVDKPMLFLENILTDLDSSRNCINYNYEGREMKAIYRSDQKQLYLMPSYTKDFLGVEEPQTRKEWMKRGITYSFDRKDRGTKVDTKQIKFSGKNYKTIPLNMNIVKELGFDFHDYGDFFSNPT